MMASFTSATIVCFLLPFLAASKSTGSFVELNKTSRSVVLSNWSERVNSPPPPPQQSSYDNHLNILDDTLGLDWLSSETDIDFYAGTRSKRVAGTDVSQSQAVLVELASETIAEDQVDIGDSFTLEFLLDLAPITQDQRSDLNIEIFALQPDLGVSSFAICQADMDLIGSYVKSVEVAPIYVEEIKPGYVNYIEKAILTLEQLSTNGNGDSSSAGQLQTQFQAVLLNTGEATTNTDYYLSAGAQFDSGGFVWITQEQITTALVTTDYDSTMDLTIAPTSIRKGDAALFLISAYITEPSASLEFGVYQPLGYNVTRTLGNAFACSQDKYWVDRYSPSPSGLTTYNISLNYPLLINREAQRDVTQDMNRITFEVPVAVLNYDGIAAGIDRHLTFELRIGSEKFWSALQLVTVLDTAPIGIPAFPTVTNITQINVPNNTYNGTLAGDAVVFSVDLLVQSGWCNFDTYIYGNSAKGVYAAGAKIVSTGYVAYFPREWAIESNDGENVTAMFGNVKNVSPNLATTVTMEISFAIDPAAPTIPINVGDVTITIGNQNVPVSFQLYSNTQATPNITVTLLPNPFLDTIFHTTGEIAMDMIVTVPSGAGAESMFIDAMPDTGITAFDVRLCRVKVYQIGDGLPCIFAANTQAQENYSMSTSAQLFNDYGEIDVGRLCPMTYPDNGDITANQFMTSLYYELPRQPTITNTPFTMSAGLRQDNETIWVTSSSYNVTGTDFTTTVIQGATANSTVTPFVTAYPVVTTFERDNPAFDMGEGLFVQYIFKPQPVTRGEYVFVIDPPANIKLCLVEIAHIGDNFPCAQVPGPTPTQYDNIVIDYGSVLPHGCDTPATISFHGLTNWGKTPIVPDLTPDENSIQIIAYFQICVQTSPLFPNSSADIVHTLKYGQVNVTNANQSISEAFTVNVTNLAKASSTSASIPGTTYSSLIGPNNVIFKSVPKLMHFEVPVPWGYLGNITVELANDLYNATNFVFVDFCAAAVVSVGGNVPCVNLLKDVSTQFGPDSKVVDGETVHRSIQVTIKDVCFVNAYAPPEASLITVEVAVRIRNDLPDGFPLNLTLNVYPQSAILVDSQKLSLKVATPGPNDIATTNLTVNQPKVYPNPNYTTAPSVSTGATQWVTFVISVPTDTTVQMEASFLMPSVNNISILHAMDVRFESTTGTNVLCTGPNVNLKKTYNTTFGKTSNLLTFMQQDAVTIDMGYVVNRGFTLLESNYNTSGYDDIFAISVLVQLSDNAVNLDQSSATIYCSVQFGDLILVASTLITVNRPNATRATEVGNLSVKASAIEAANTGIVLSKMNQVHISTVMYHLPNSKAEGYPTYLRVIVPNYLLHTINETMATNYTPGVTVTATINNTYLDYVFTWGVLYPDFVNLNFTLTVDPNSVRLAGSGTALATVLMQPLCTQNQFGGVPATGHLTRPCGDMTSVSVNIQTAECYDPIPMINNCQMRASSMISSMYKPANVLSNTSVWSPAVRDGVSGVDYIEFDFLTSTRLNRIFVGTNNLVGTKTYLTAQTVRVEASNTPGAYNTIVNAVLNGSNLISLPMAVVARYVKLTILKISPGDTSVYSVGMNSVSFQGCLPAGAIRDASTCFAATTLDASDVTSYRHFAVDDANNIVYFCDINPYLKTMQCFSSNGADGTNSWLALPTTVKRVIGYSPSRGRMYLSSTNGNTVATATAGYLSTMDGGKTMLQVTGAFPTDIIAAVVVPGDVAANVGNINWPGVLFNYKGTFTGLFNGGTMIAQWKSCCAP